MSHTVELVIAAGGMWILLRRSATDDTAVPKIQHITSPLRRRAGRVGTISRWDGRTITDDVYFPRDGDSIHPHHISLPESRTSISHEQKPDFSATSPVGTIRICAALCAYPSVSIHGHDGPTPVGDGCAFGFCKCRVVDTTATRCNANIDHMCEHKRS
ncbi:uncharacterized protein K489DRAFT_367921 [Dissoconium aciculare CBS 342.82]|uniref:Uncharacterized protein n=1 Tax=Dissoconium aciculare CBS 342.82 TaxID=1314786 RepID=A0A6J3MFI3_9PEZI|nr:uncharacterized protein K489DRAFT_367921 [Dissoconium aciculare CBS 342.82]KAF1826735.1 hypothetical protein K489DRAFT_367921 [Dissoconium aciculare CBS 342.82]